MIVVGIAPGVRNLAYCVLHYKEGHLPRVPKFGADVLKGVKPGTDKDRLRDKVAIHMKVFEVVLERFPPTIIAIGPPAVKSEPRLYIEAARLVVGALVARLQREGVPVELVSLRTRDELVEALGATSWSSALSGRLEPMERVKTRSVKVAAATALAAVAITNGNHR